MSSIAAAGPVIPKFGSSDCDAHALVCGSWLQEHWSSDLLPRLIEHIYITAISISIGLVISLLAALYGYSRGWFSKGFFAVSAFFYTVPPLAFFLVFVPITGLSLLTIEIGLTSYTLLLLFRNTLTGLQSAPEDVVIAARGVGMTPRQILLRVNLPLALPSIIAGLRISVVTAISLATIAAKVTPLGLGQPIVFAMTTSFVPQLFSAAVLVIVLALVADTLVVLLGRSITPWMRAHR